ncbi:hypothetical protein Scep_028490 [Stephania cephalantha]|uniref:Uncharacterized protein n=1 Tax=Stephania cephalantha TaxID=152367 RepID=A0AAP0EHD2_9MAGN
MHYERLCFGKRLTVCTGRLELLNEEEYILGIRIVGGDHRLKTMIRCNLKSLSEVSERLTLQDRTTHIRHRDARAMKRLAHASDVDQLMQFLISMLINDQITIIKDVEDRYVIALMGHYKSKHKHD